VSSKLTEADEVLASKAVLDLQQLVDRARRGDASALPMLREIMQKAPSLVDNLGGNLAEQAEASLIKAAAGDDLAFKESITRKLELLRAELAGPSPPPLERLLVERVVACWLQVQEADIRYSQTKDPSVKWAEYLQRRMTHAHKRYLSAIKTLALIRKLAVPVLQVNIAKKQVNVAGPVVAVGEAV
jgi:hypothetical protein